MLGYSRTGYSFSYGGFPPKDKVKEEDRKKENEDMERQKRKEDKRKLLDSLSEYERSLLRDEE